MADVSVQDVEMTYRTGQAALRDVTFDVAAGEFVALVGPSGCGKSTLLRLVAGLAEPTGGRLTVAGHPPVVARRDWHRLAYVFQEPNLLPWRDVAANIRLPMELCGVARARQAERVEQSLGQIGLSPADAGKRPHMLSGGMKMRVSLARALVTHPELLLLDEPFGALDDLLRQQLNEELQRIWSAQKFTALFVTHNVAEAVFLSQRVLVMARGPGAIVSQVPVPFPTPRAAEIRSNPEFAQLCGQIARLLRNGVA